VALAGEQNGVAGPREADGAPDGRPPVEVDLVVDAASESGTQRALLHVAGGDGRVVVDGVIGGDHEPIGPPRGSQPHPGAVVVGTGGGAKDRKQPAGRDGSQLGERLV
jgi:hypothetical protein